MKVSIFFFFVLLSIGCKKDKEYCWQLYDALGNQFSVVCEKTEAEMASQYGAFFDRQDAPKYCWKIKEADGSFSYPGNLTEKMAGVFFPGAVSKEKIACGYCQRWTWREKGLHKPTGSFAYQPIRLEVFCGDTCNTLFVGRIVTIRDTPDSLITVEFLQKN